MGFSYNFPYFRGYPLLGGCFLDQWIWTYACRRYRTFTLHGDVGITHLTDRGESKNDEKYKTLHRYEEIVEL